MRPEDFDRVLSKEQEIAPSSGFVASVMDAVRRAIETPPPIPFPWRRALPGLSAAGFGLASVLVLGVMLSRETAPQPLPAGLLPVFVLIVRGWKAVGANWIALALVLSLASLKLSARIVSRKACLAR